MRCGVVWWILKASHINVMWCVWNINDDDQRVEFVPGPAACRVSAKSERLKKGVSFCSILILNYLLRLLKRKSKELWRHHFSKNFMIFIAFLQVICCGWQSHMMIECVLVVGFFLSALSLKSETEIFWSIDDDKEFVACNNATDGLHWTLTETKQRMQENES